MAFARLRHMTRFPWPFPARRLDFSRLRRLLVVPAKRQVHRAVEEVFRQKSLKIVATSSRKRGKCDQTLRSFTAVTESRV
jgi:hypothetical protein